MPLTPQQLKRLIRLADERSRETFFVTGDQREALDRRYTDEFTERVVAPAEADDDEKE